MSVALETINGFDHVAAGDFATQDGWAGTCLTVKGLVGGVGRAIRNPSGCAYTFGTASDTVLVGARIFPRDTGTLRELVALYDGASALSIRVQRAADDEIIVTTNGGGGPFNSGVFWDEDTVHTLEFGVLIGTSSGTLRLVLDGVEVLALSGINTRGSAAATVARIDMTNPQLNVDDFHLQVGTGGHADTDFLSDTVGNPFVHTHFPISDGTLIDWTVTGGGSGSPYTFLSEQMGDGTGTELETLTLADRQSWGHGNLPTSAETILALATTMQVRDDAGAEALQHVLTINGTDYDSAVSPVTLAATYAYQRRLWVTHPASGLPWTLDQYTFDAEPGVRRTSATSANKVFISQAVVEILYRKGPTAGATGKAVPVAFLPEKNRLASPSPFLWLVQIKIPSTPEVMLRVTPNGKPVTFDTDSEGEPLTWDPFPINIGLLAEDSEGGTPEVTLTVGGISREIMAQLVLHKYLLDQPVLLRLVHSANLSDPNASYDLDFTITGATADEEAVTFTLSSQNLYKLRVPNERVQRLFCRFRYRDGRCGFTGDPNNTLGNCLKTPAECTKRGQWQIDNAVPQTHPARIGAYPGVPAK